MYIIQKFHNFQNQIYVIHFKNININNFELKRWSPFVFPSTSQAQNKSNMWGNGQTILSSDTFLSLPTRSDLDLLIPICKTSPFRDIGFHRMRLHILFLLNETTKAKKCFSFIHILGDVSGEWRAHLYHHQSFIRNPREEKSLKTCHNRLRTNMFHSPPS